METKHGRLVGTLVLPTQKKTAPLALIIAGSGPTDRDGNQPGLKNDSLKLLAHRLAEKGIASLRYDKRGVGHSGHFNLQESQLRFEDYVSDAANWLRHLGEDKGFTKITVIGHSEGALIGMIAAQQVAVTAYVSIAGPALPAGEALKQQLASQTKPIQDLAFPIIDALNRGEYVQDVDPILYSLFRPSVQPYLISWFKYDPATELSMLSVPALIVQGTTDIQVPQEHAHQFAQRGSEVEVEIIKNMNHVLKVAPSNRVKNFQTYNDPTLALAPTLVDKISGFIIRH